MTLAGRQGLSADDFDLVHNRRSRVLHVIDYDHRVLCGRGGSGEWDHMVYNKHSVEERVHPLCKQCVARNLLFDLRTTEQILADNYELMAGALPTDEERQQFQRMHREGQLSTRNLNTRL